MNTCLSSFLALTEKLLCSPVLAGTMSRTEGHAGIKVVCCDLWLEDALRASTALQVGRLGFFA